MSQHYFGNIAIKNEGRSLRRFNFKQKLASNLKQIFNFLILIF